MENRDKKQVYIGGFKEFRREPLPKTGVFVAHDFFGDDEITRSDYRTIFEDGFTDSPFMPIYAPIVSGTILETLIQSMINTDAGIFDVSINREYNANVLIELGVALALNHPTLVIAKDNGSPLLDFLEELKPLRYRNATDLSKRIAGAVEQVLHFHDRVNPYFCVICQQKACKCRKRVHQEPHSYLLLGADLEDDEVERHVNAAIRDFQLTRLDYEDTLSHHACRWLHTTRRSQFVFLYSKALGKAHHGVENAITMVQLGMAVGSAIPWRVIVPPNEVGPTDVSAFMSVQMNDSATIFRGRLKAAASVLMGEHNPYHGIYIGLEPPLEAPLKEEESGNLSVAPVTGSDGRVPKVFVSYATKDREVVARIRESLTAAGVSVWLDELIVGGEDWESIIQNTLNNADILLYISSHASKTSRVVQSEWELALQLRKPVITVFIENAEIPVELLAFDHFDLRHDYEAGITHLIEQLYQQVNLPKVEEIPEEFQKEVFIAYRHKSGAEQAQQLQDILKRNSYMSFDLEAITAQDIEDNNIYWERAMSYWLTKSGFFVLLVTPGMFNQATDHNDRLWMAILAAYQLQKPIIPVAQDANLRWDYIPDKLAFVKNYDWIISPSIEEVVPRLLERFVGSEIQPNIQQEPIQEDKVPSSALANEISSENINPLTQPKRENKNIFVSYSKKNKKAVKNDLIDILRMIGHDVWFDHWLIAGRSWKLQLEEQIKKSDIFIFVITPDSLKSYWCQWEYNFALEQRKPIIPVVMKSTKIPLEILELQFVDFTTEFKQMAIAKLVDGIKHAIYEPMAAKPFHLKD